MIAEHIKIKNFKLSVPAAEMTDTKFMSSAEKKDVLKKWVAFLSNHFKPSTFNKKLYQHLHLHCGYIAHYNQNAFYGKYFEKPAQFHWLAFGTKKAPTEYDGFYVSGNHVGMNAVESKEAFLNIWKELNLSRRAYVNDEGLGGFFYGWNGLIHSHEDYRDLNKAMQNVFKEYVTTWEMLIADAEQVRIRKEIAEQRERVTKTLTDAADQLKEIETEMPKTTSNTTKPMSLLEFLLDEAV